MKNDLLMIGMLIVSTLFFIAAELRNIYTAIKKRNDTD